MRTTEIGACTPPNGTTPGRRLPVRTITLPPISSRRIRFGEPTSSRVSGVTVAAFSPSPCSRIAAAASWTTAFLVARRDSSERSKRGRSISSPITSGARTRSDSSRSSWPVWSPSRTAIAFQLHGGGKISDGVLRGMLAANGGEDRVDTHGVEAALPLLSTRTGARSPTRKSSSGCARSRSHRRGRTSGSRRRRARSCRRPASTPRAGSSTSTTRPIRARAGAGEVRAADRLRGAASRPPRRRWRSTWSSTGYPADKVAAIAVRLDQSRLVPRRRRPLREAITHLRDHDAPEEPRDRARLAHLVPLPRQALDHAAERRRRPRAGCCDSRLARRARAAALPVRAAGWDALQPRSAQAQRLREETSRRRLHREGLPDVGRHAARRDRVRPARAAGESRRREEANCGSDAPRRRDGSETHRRSHGRRT